MSRCGVGVESAGDLPHLQAVAGDSAGDTGPCQRAHSEPHRVTQSEPANHMTGSLGVGKPPPSVLLRWGLGPALGGKVLPGTKTDRGLGTW